MYEIQLVNPKTGKSEWKQFERIPEGYSGKVIERVHARRKRVYTINNEPSMTDQSQADDCDVNLVMNRVLKTRDESILKRKQGFYAEVSEFRDLGTHLMQVQEAQEAFMALPAELRRKFNNNPVEMIEFLDDPSKIEESITLGLRVKTEEAPPKTEEPPKTEQP